MSLTRQDVALIQSLISRALNQRQPPIARDGMAVNGTYNPVDGTIGTKLCDTDAMFGSGDQPTAVPRVPQAQAIYGDQYGARGGERTTLVMTQHGFDSLYTYDEDDSPGAPSGEIWRVHRNAAGEVDTSSKWTNDGPTEGDGLGGQVHVAGALHSVATAGGLTTTHNDETQQITHTAGTVKAIYDAQGQVMHLVAVNGVGVGDLFSNLGATRAAFANADATTLTNNLKQVIGNVAQQMAQAAIAAGVTNATTWLAGIQAGLPSLSFVNIASSIPAVTVPPGSSTVRLRA